jgi:hypothetical protein
MQRLGSHLRRLLKRRIRKRTDLDSNPAAVLMQIERPASSRHDYTSINHIKMLQNILHSSNNDLTNISEPHAIPQLSNTNVITGHKNKTRESEVPYKFVLIIQKGTQAVSTS